MWQKRHFGFAILAITLLMAPMAVAESIEFRPATEADHSIPLRTGVTAFAATSLDAETRCGQSLPRFALIDLAWDAARDAGSVRVDISKFPEGFATGRFETTGALTGSLAEVSVEAPEPGVNYYWRVLSGSAEGWTSSSVERFLVPVCKADALEPGQVTGFILNDGPKAAGEEQ